MSNSVTNVEIEDVLSSIRRLVSEDTKPKAPKSAPSEDKLVLTPADRVSEAVQAPQAEAPEEISERPRPYNHYINGGDSGERQAANAHVDEAPTGEYEEDDDREENLAGADTQADTHEQAQKDASSDEPEAKPETDARQASAIENRIAELEEAVDGQPDEWEPDGSEMNAANDDVVTSIPAFMHRSDRSAEAKNKSFTYSDDSASERAEHSQDDNAESHVKPSGDAPDQSLDDAGDEDVHVQAEESAEDVGEQNSVFRHEDRDDVEDAVSVRDDADSEENDGNEDSNEDREASNDAEIFDEVEEADFVDVEADEDNGEADQQDGATDATVLETAAAEEALEAALSDEVDDEAYLDEETIREMVRDIVREELQGVLGERITRNVRKLVRREIHRALTSNELE